MDCWAIIFEFVPDQKSDYFNSPSTKDVIELIDTLSDHEPDSTTKVLLFPWFKAKMSLNQCDPVRQEIEKSRVFWAMKYL